MNGEVIPPLANYRGEVRVEVKTSENHSHNWQDEQAGL